MIEIHAVVIALVVFAIISMASFCVLAYEAVIVAQDESEFWRDQYLTLNAKVRPALSDAVENLVPVTDAARERLDSLKKLLETKDAAS